MQQTFEPKLDFRFWIALQRAGLLPVKSSFFLQKFCDSSK